ncbi:S41 family peptidase [Clostridiaceae bacterium M8S5]|nr:S41 family peptidase [Clostridiaceae bacterium M8S5]
MKNNKKFRIIGLIIVLSLVLTITAGSVIAKEEKEKDKYEDGLVFLGKLMNYVESRYAGEIDSDKLIEGAIKGVFDQLDDHSEYFTAEEFKRLNQDTSGNFGGIGVVVATRNGYVTVLSVLEDGPSKRLGIKAKDKIVTVDGTDIKDYNLYDAIVLIRGKVGTTVKIGIVREGQSGIKHYEIKRKLIKSNPISVKTLKNNIGYIKLKRFNANTNEEMTKVLKDFNNKNITKLIVDLRNNGGGYLDQVLKVLQNFVPKGPLVHIKYADGTTNTKESYLSKTKYDIVVLVNGGSASASEIFAGAIQDSKVGTIIGTKTYGKGSVQDVIPLKNEAGFKVTIAEYFTPNKNKVDKVGITPDIVIEDVFDHLESEIDTALLDRLNKGKEYKVGQVGLEVLVAEEILDYMKYSVSTPDGVFDERTQTALKKFQKANKLTPDGKLSDKTQEALKEALIEYLNSEAMDRQLNKAIEIISKK